MLILNLVMKFNKIIIVGGGSAGWMTAATLVKAFPDKHITVIEPDQQSGIGVGESTTQLMRRWQEFLEIPNEDFITKFDGTNKLAIRFENFHKKGKSFYYPFGRIDQRYYNVQEWFAHQYLTKVPFENFVNDMSPIAECLENNTVPEYIDFWSLDKDAAWHFDTHKFYSYLRDEYSIPKGVNVIRGSVAEAIKDEDGNIISVIVENQNHLGTSRDYVTGDLFFDCTGFHRVLIEGALNEPWVGFNNKTYTDSAWAAQRPYKDKEKELKLYTNSVAMSSGWIWEIPHWNSMGTGYNYSKEHLTKDEALAEFKEYLGDVSEEMEFKHINTRNGMSERMWVKNCVSIGLSGAFIEPLESNGLMSIHEFLLVFCNVAEGKDTLNNFDAHTFNHVCREQFLHFADFITLHYAMTARDDTPFWKDIQNQDFTDSKLLKQIYDLRAGSFLELPDLLKSYDLNASLYMLAGHEINPYTAFKLSNMNFWGENFTIKVGNMVNVIEKHRHHGTYPSAVEYYGNYHR